MKLESYPGVTKAIRGTRVRLPDPDVHHMLYIATDIPLPKQQTGYDRDRLEKLLHATGETMDEIGADKAEIYNAQDGHNS